MEVESSASALHEVWFSRHLVKAFKDTVLAKSVAGAFVAPSVVTMLDVLEHPEGRFADNANEKRNQLLLSTLHDAYEDMEKLQGPDPNKWAWGKLHHSFLQHPFSAIVDEATREKVDVGPLDRAGGPFTVNRSSYRAGDFRETVGPSVPVVIDPGNWDNFAGDKSSGAVRRSGQSTLPRFGAVVATRGILSSALHP